MDKVAKWDICQVNIFCNHPTNLVLSQSIMGSKKKMLLVR